MGVPELERHELLTLLHEKLETVRAAVEECGDFSRPEDCAHYFGEIKRVAERGLALCDAEPLPDREKALVGYEDLVLSTARSGGFDSQEALDVMERLARALGMDFGRLAKRVE